MPIIEVHTYHQAPPPQICQQMLTSLAADLGAPPENTILNWRAIGPKDLLQRNGQAMNAAFVQLHCRACYGDERIGYSLGRLVEYLSSMLKIPPETILAVVNKKNSGEVFVNGSLYKENKMKQKEIKISPIGKVSTKRSTPEDDYWGDTVSWIEVLPEYADKNALKGLEEFSHLEVLYQFDQVPESSVVPGSRHPRGNKEFPEVGIFAQRGKDRPNRLGISRCEILKVEKNRVMVRGLDAIDGSPVIDLKPYMEEFGPRGNVRQPEWTRVVMRDYFKAEGDR